MCLKYERFTPSGLKDLGIRKFEFAAKTINSFHGKVIFFSNCYSLRNLMLNSHDILCVVCYILRKTTTAKYIPSVLEYFKSYFDSGSLDD